MPPPAACAAAALATADPRLAAAIEIIGPCTVTKGRGSPYESLLSAIAHQQVHGAAAKAILARFRGLYPDGCYPAPAELLATADARLRAAGLSRAKVAAIKDVAARTLDGMVPDRRGMLRLSDEEVIERLSAVRGVGRWTAEMLLMFTLNRPDVLPVGDFGIRHSFKLLYRKRAEPKPRWLAAYGERWAPYRTTASWYLWRYLDYVRDKRRNG
ncbi:MAG TPA: DNA-3-methyladenine glycosylase [Steroidobacteraceae bacterium]|nr:DNA-3-methyladenine glycosylase [Steroidobacteraceae bacterium]